MAAQILARIPHLYGMLNFLGFLSITVFGVDCMLTANAVLWWPVCDNCTSISHRMTGRPGKAR